MTLKKGILILFGFFSFTICIGIIYLFNDEKFYPEYWLKLEIDKLGDRNLLTKNNNSVEFIRYRFYYEHPTIDFSISLDAEGKLIIQKSIWFGPKADTKTYLFKVGKDEYNRIKNKTKSVWSVSKTEAEDYKLGALYYSIELIDQKELSEELELNFYNVTPESDFLLIKNELLMIAKNAIKEQY